MSAHTLGPWHVVETYVADRDYRDIAHSDNRVGAASATIARVTVRSTWREEQLANARLIAAAPELLATLKDIAEGRYCEGDEVGMARAAIAKATGTPSP